MIDAFRADSGVVGKLRLSRVQRRHNQLWRRRWCRVMDDFTGSKSPQRRRRQLWCSKNAYRVMSFFFASTNNIIYFEMSTQNKMHKYQQQTLFLLKLVCLKRCIPPCHRRLLSWVFCRLNQRQRCRWRRLMDWWFMATQMKLHDKHKMYVVFSCLGDLFTVAHRSKTNVHVSRTF